MARGATASQLVTQDASQSATQEEAERDRELRRGYRDLQQSLQRSKNDLGDYSKEALQQALADADRLHEKVNRPREQAKDSEVFCTLAASGVEQAKKLAAGTKSRTAKDVIRRLKFRFAADPTEVEEDPTAYDWAAGGLHCLHLFGCAVGVGCMLGPLSAQPKVRKVAERRQKTKLGALEKPKEITHVNTEEKQETDRLMEEMWSLLEAHRTLPWLELVMNVESFSQTVENIFTLSFLVRDGKVSFTPDKERGMQVHIVVEKKGEKTSNKPEDRVQAMQSYSMTDWHDWKGYVTAEACLMEHRTGQMYTDAAAAEQRGQGGGATAGGQATQQPTQGQSRRGNKSKWAATADRDDGTELEGDDYGDEAVPDQQNHSKKARRHVDGRSDDDDDSEGETCRPSKPKKKFKRHG